MGQLYPALSNQSLRLLPTIPAKCFYAVRPTGGGVLKESVHENMTSRWPELANLTSRRLQSQWEWRETWGQSWALNVLGKSCFVLLRSVAYHLGSFPIVIDGNSQHKQLGFSHVVLLPAQVPRQFLRHTVYLRWTPLSAAHLACQRAEDGLSRVTRLMTVRLSCLVVYNI